ncbi:MAG: hypothetical protein FWF05_08765 [Oscillospiraceae bacterium]|nr:hypothetical protein [Oscillospiraceae bacterium]
MKKLLCGLLAVLFLLIFASCKGGENTGGSEAVTGEGYSDDASVPLEVGDTVQ